MARTKSLLIALATHIPVTFNARGKVAISGIALRKNEQTNKSLKTRPQKSVTPTFGTLKRCQTPLHTSPILVLFTKSPYTKI